MKRKFAWSGVVALVVVAASTAWWWKTQRTGDEPQYRTAEIERGSVTASVAASGTINPVASVQVSSQVSGQLKEVLADYNSEVRRGQVLARIDAETFRLRVNQSQADLDAARSQVLVQDSQVSQRHADIARTEVTLAETRRDLARKEELLAKSYISAAELDRVAAQVRIQQEDVKTARAGLRIALAQVQNSQAGVKQRQAALASARVDLERTVIRSPVDGIVIKRAVDAGETVAASLAAPTMFVIARNLRDMQVDTSIDESDISRIRLGQKASFSVDAFPGRSFEGAVTQVRKAAQNIQNVVTYIVVITFANADGALQPGMTANVRVVTETRSDVLKVANGALRFRPAGESSVAPTGGADARASVGPGSGGGLLVAFRERLEQELAPSPEQRLRLDAIFAAMREKYTGLRAMPAEQRGKLSEVYRAELRALVGEMLNPEQKRRYDALLQEIAGRAGGVTTGAGALGRGRIYVLDNGKPRAVPVRTGISDGTATEVIGVGLAEGGQVITGTLGQTATMRSPGSSLPRFR